MLWICRNCTTAYSVDASACPQCGADDHVDEGTVVEVSPEAADDVDAEGDA